MNNPDRIGEQPGQSYVKPLDDGAVNTLPRRLHKAWLDEQRRADVLAQTAADAIIEGHTKDTEIFRLQRLLARQARLDNLRAIRKIESREASLQYKLRRGAERFFDKLGSVAVKTMQIMAETDPASGVNLAQIPCDTKS